MSSFDIEYCRMMHDAYKETYLKKIATISGMHNIESTRRFTKQDTLDDIRNEYERVKKLQTVDNFWSFMKGWTPIE